MKNQRQNVVHTLPTKATDNHQCEADDASKQKNEINADVYLGTVCQSLHYDKQQKAFFIEHPFNKQYLIEIANCTISIDPTDAGSMVTVVFEQGKLNRPVITGKLQLPSHTPRDLTAEWPPSEEIDIQIDQKDKRIFRAKEEIILQCGKSSITLTKSGKILIRGVNISTLSTSVNKIKGSTIQLN